MNYSSPKLSSERASSIHNLRGEGIKFCSLKGYFPAKPKEDSVQDSYI